MTNAIKKLVIYGASFPDVVKLVDAINRACPTWTILGYLDDNPKTHGDILMGYPVLGGVDRVQDYVSSGAYFFVNISSHWSRVKAVADRLESFGCQMATLVHPAVDMNYVEIGKGCIVPEGSVIGSNVKIGDYVMIRLKTLISHDVTLEDFTFVGGGATVSSYAVLRLGCYIGAGATIMRKTVVGEAAIVGAGAVVTRDVPADVTVTGVPAKVLSKANTKV